MWLLTPQESYKTELFAGVCTTVTSDIYSLQDSGEAFGLYLNEAVSLSVFTSDVEVASDKNILVLSACSDEADHSRFVVLGKLMPVPGYARD